MRCLEALRRSERRPDEVIVVADGCRDGSAKAARDFGALVIETRRAVGPAAARNLGAKEASGDILIFMDADVAFHPDTIGRFVQILDEHGDVAAVFGNYDDAPPGRGVLSRYKNLLQHFVHLAAPEEAFTFWGACGAIRREVFQEVGGFNEAYEVPSIEDIELGYRLRAAGHRIVHRRDILATHLKSWTAHSIFMSDVLRRAVPWTMLIRRSGVFHDGLNISGAERLKVAAVWLAVGLIPLAVLIPWAALLSAMLLLAVLVANGQLIGFLWRRGGWRVAVVGTLWHLFYHWYCGLGFVLGSVASLFDRNRLKSAYSRPVSKPRIHEHPPHS